MNKNPENLQCAVGYGLGRRRKESNLERVKQKLRLLKHIHYKRHAIEFLPCKKVIHFKSIHGKFAHSCMKLPWCNG